jgi:hypothetical protein
MKENALPAFLLITILIVLFTSLLSAERPVKLYKEESDILLEQGKMAVSGCYYFENRSDFELDVSIIYPFQVNEQQIYPDKVTLLDPDNPIAFEREGAGIKWTQHFEPSSIETVLVAYEQELKKREATYILKRKFLNGKVDKSSLVIQAPLEFTNVSFSVEPDSASTDENHQYFYLTRRYFTPKKNLTITWE